MLWGSKRTGPDLARVGEKYSDAWHVAHLVDPRAVVPESNMPRYGFLLNDTLEVESLSDRLRALRRVGVPYTDEMIANARVDAIGQGIPDSASAEGVVGRYGEATHVRAFDGDPSRLTEMDAVVAYLQILGRLTDVAVASATPPEE
jgi:cytochrome c oxidase cbb3-type subunit 2